MSESSFVNFPLPDNLNAAERKFVDCMKAGAPCAFDKAEQDANANVIRGILICFFALGGDKDNRMGGNIIYLQGARISSGLNLVHVRTAYSLVLVGCHFAERIMMPHSAFHFLNLNGSFLKGGLVGDGMKIASDILLKEGFTSEGEVGLISADIGGNLDCNNGQFKNKEGVAINAEKIKVRGGVRIGEGLYAEGETRLIGADIGAELYCSDGKFVNKKGYAFCADNMKVSGSVFMRKGFLAEGEVQLLGATIGGDWYCGDANFNNEEQKALVADNVRVDGNLLMQDGFVAKGEVRLSGAHIGGNVSCRGGVFDNKKGQMIPEFETKTALVAQGIKLDGSLMLTHGFSAAGVVVLHNAEIGGGVFCDGGIFTNENNKALVIDGATIGGDLYMRQISTQGEVRLLRADIGGDFVCDNGNFNNKAGEAILADGIKIRGFWAMRQGFSAKGRVQLLSADIGGDILCHGGHFSNEGGNAFVANHARIGGTLSMVNNFVAKGEVRLLHANIGGNFQCDGATIYGNINAQGLHVKNSLRWKRVSGNGTVNLNSAAVSVLDDDVESCERFRFSLDGFSYDQFANPGDVKSRIGWLSRPKGVKLSSQPFQQVAKVLFAMGQDSDARRVLFEAEKAATDNYAPKNWWQWLFYPVWWLWRQFLRITTGYNYLLWRMFRTSIVIIALGAWIFCEANECGYIVPHQPVVLANPEYKELVKCARAQAGEVCSATQSPTEVAARLFPDYPRFNAILFSLDTFLPTSPLKQETYWYPQLDANTPDDWRRLLTVWYAFQIIIGWLLVSLITLTYTRILQRRQTGGTGDK